MDARRVRRARCRKFPHPEMNAPGLLRLPIRSANDGASRFRTIVAGGRNACRLHYAKKDEPSGTATWC